MHVEKHYMGICTREKQRVKWEGEVLTRSYKSRVQAGEDVRKNASSVHFFFTPLPTYAPVDTHPYQQYPSPH